MTKLVWAYKPLQELNNRTGFVEADDKIAAKLLKSGDVQNPQIGSNHLKYIDTSKPVKKEAKNKVTKDVKESTKTTKTTKSN